MFMFAVPNIELKQKALQKNFMNFEKGQSAALSAALFLHTVSVMLLNTKWVSKCTKTIENDSFVSPGLWIK